MTTINEPRALSAALSGPTFHTRGADRAMHVANRHVERWAPETGASRVRSMSSLGFVDRLVAPWIETAQRSASMRLFQQYTRTGASEREGGAVSWVFPRPWYQDELDWMTAARQVQTTTQEEQAPAPRLLTTRGTYVPPATASASIMPAALYEYVAPSLSIAAPAAQDRISGVGHGGSHPDAYSPLVSLAAVQAAHVMSRTVGAFAGRTGDPGASRMAPALRSVLTTMLARAAQGPDAAEPTRAARFAPELVTPPAPRPDRDTRDAGEPLAASADASEPASPSTQLAEQYAEQRAQIVELQRLARRSAASTLSTSAPEASSVASEARTAEVSAARTAEARTAEARVAAAITAEAQVAAARTREARVAEARTTEERAIERAEARVRERTEVEQRTAVEQRERTAVEQRERTVVEQRERTEERVRAVDAQRRVVQQSQAEQVERTRAEAPRGQVRLHEQSRADAAAHARALGDAPAAARPSEAPVERVAEMRAPAEVAAAIAALPPQLQSYLGQRPGRAMEAISELQDVLRTAELLARSSASGGTMEVTRGPRMMMPAGLGGLVAAVDRAPLLAPAQPALAPLALTQAQQASQSPMAMTAAPTRRDVRAPALPWLAAPRMSAPTNALQATSTAQPAALTHVAWADRWLARFAGASAQSLEVLHASASGSPHVRMQALAAAAPGEVFVAPVFDSETVRGSDRAPARDLSAFTGTSEGPISVPAQARASAPSMAAAAGPTLRPETPLVERYADDAETPDDVFLQIAAAAATRRTQPAPQAVASSAGAAAGLGAFASTSTAGFAEPPRATERATVADMVAHAAPSAPGAGLSAQLASSPFASALRHVLPLPAAASFDIRALFADGLSSTYLAGLLAPASHEIEIASSVTPAFTTQFQARELAATRETPAWDATYVTPELRGADAAESGDATRFDATDAEPAALAQLDALTAAAAASPTVTSSTGARADQPVAAGPELRALIEATAPLTTLRSALLSWTAEVDASGAPIAGSASSPVMAGSRTSPVTTGTARAMIDAMALPMLTETPDEHERSSAWTSPGMVAGRAHAWSVAQERSASDLSLDFVTPELVLAARVYGLGPAEAAQAARLALAGPGQLTAMAGAVDRTFVQAMAIEAERRRSGDDQGRGEFASQASEGRAVRASTVASMPAPQMPGALASASTSVATGEPSVTGAPLATAYPLSTGELVAATARPAIGTSSFGVERRAPRGAFLWPSATIAALGMSAASPEGEQSMSVAALELLAAQAVAEIGTFAALGEYGMRGEQGEDDVSSSSSSAFDASPTGSVAATAGGPGSAVAGSMSSLVGGVASAAASSAFGREAAGAEPAEADVLGAVAALVPSARRARFEAMYVALSESPSGRSWSPAARAARALALAGRGDDAPTSAYARAAAAWDVMPVVYAADGRPLDGGAADEATSVGGSRGAVASSAARFAVGGRGASRTGASRDVVGSTVASETRPGLSGLSARAGEALGSYVSPAAAEASRPAARTEAEPSVYQRAPSAAQELVRTGRPAGRHGGGEAEIPAWFEKAARKMLDERSGASDGISLAELTLVSAAPASQVAASSVTAAPAPAATPAAAAKPGDEQEVDVDKLADEIFRQIMVMMDSARARNGEPYL